MARHAELLARYQHLRQVGRLLNNKLVQSLSKSVLDEGGKRLGILKGKTLLLDTEDVLAVLMDYCIHDVRRKGLNAVQRYLAETPPAPDPDEMVILRALRQARFSLFAVEATEPGVEIRVLDLLRDEPLSLVDIGFSHTAAVGTMLAARVMSPDGIGMTTGSALPAGVLPPAGRARFLQGLAALLPGMDLRHPSPEQASELAGSVIRTCLQQGAAERIGYVDPNLEAVQARLPAAPPRARRLGRNEPCPCGSGRKYKHCCGSRR
jgi:hypothetical protein